MRTVEEVENLIDQKRDEILDLKSERAKLIQDRDGFRIHRAECWSDFYYQVYFGETLIHEFGKNYTVESEIDAFNALVKLGKIEVHPYGRKKS